MSKNTVSLITISMLLASILVLPGLSENVACLLLDGNTLYVGGSGPGNYTKIQDAIDNASNGDTVFVYHHSMPYYENIVVDKSIRLIGEDRNTTIIDGNGIGNVTMVIADNVHISGFTIQHSGNYSLYGYTDSGIFLLSDNNNIIRNIIKENPGDGITARDSSDNIIADNIVIRNRYSGIDLCNNSRNNRIENNTVSYSDNGIYLGQEICMVSTPSCINNTIAYNIVSSCRLASINFYSGCNNNRISHNILKNKRGLIYYLPGYYSIWMYRSNNNTIVENIFDNKGILRFNMQISQCFNNSILHNNFLKVSPHIYFVESSNNQWDGNYWGRPRLMPKIILGKNNHTDQYPTAMNFDMHPAMKSYTFVE